MLATGKLVSWITSDDSYLAGAFEIVQQAHLNNPNASFYYDNGHRVNAGAGSTTPCFILKAQSNLALTI